MGEFASLARISQPAASQHLRVLTSARLTTIRREDTRRYYRADPRGLGDLRHYIESLGDDVLQAFAAADPAPPRSKGSR